MPSATRLSAFPKIISPTVHAHSDLLSKINSSSNDRFFWFQPLHSQFVVSDFITFSQLFRVSSTR